MNAVVIGVGNPERGDDAVGPLAARRVRDAGLAGVRVLERSGEGASLIEAWDGAERAILIDALQPAGWPGRIVRFDAGAGPVPRRAFVYSSHAFSVAEAVELARVLGLLPPRLIVYGVEGQDFGFGQAPGPAVVAALARLVPRVIEELCTNAPWLST